MKLSHRIEAAAVHAAVRLLRLLGPARSSNLCGALARGIGPLLPVSRVAHTNLRLAMPELDAATRRRIVRGVWDNLGRTVGELPHVPSMTETASGPGWEFQGEEVVTARLRDGGATIGFTAHYGNWEITPRAMAQKGIPFGSVYRTVDNPALDEMLRGLRLQAVGGGDWLFAKGAAGARQALAHLRAGRTLGMLVDQKMNDGIEARLFGRKAMTAAAPAAMALRLRCAFIPCHVIRIGPARFRVVCEKPLDLPDTGDRAADVAKLTQAMNDRIEAWVREAPEGWLWLHRRFPKEVYT